MTKVNNIFIALFLIAGLYFSTSAGGILGSNDGSQYALIRTVFEDKALKITRYINYTNYVNVAYYKGSFYSDRAPGTLIISTPFYFAGKVINNLFSLSSDPDSFESSVKKGIDLSYSFPAFGVIITYLLMLPAVVGAGSVLLVYFASLLLGASKRSAFISALGFGFGTIAWRYSTVLFSHIISAFVLLLFVVLLLYFLKSKKEIKTIGWLFLSFLLGFLLILEYQNIVYLAGVLVFLLFKKEQLFSVIPRKTILLSVFVFLVPISICFLYNYLSFDNPLKTAYSYHYVYDWARSLKVLFSGSFREGFLGLLFSKMRDGIFVSSPIVLFGLVGTYLLYKTHKSEAILFTLLAWVPILVLAKEKEWHGGFDPRYILPAIAFLIIPISIFLDKISSKYYLYILFTLTLMYSVIFHIREIPLFAQRTANYLPIYTQSSVGVYMPNLVMLPYFLLLVAFMSLVIFCVSLLLKKSLLKPASLLIFLIVGFVSFFYIKTYARTPFINENFHYYESFDNPLDLTRNPQLLDVTVAESIIYPSEYDRSGYILYTFKFDKELCKFSIIPKGVITGKSNISVFVSNTDKPESAIQVYSINSNGTERSIRPTIEISKYANEFKNITVSFVLTSNKESKALFDSRLLNIDFGGGYCE